MKCLSQVDTRRMLCLMAPKHQVPAFEPGLKA
jgi:hypothetical protein